MQTPIIWPGGKSKLISDLLPLIPPHKCRVEGFGGGATFTLMDPPSGTQVYNDLNDNIVRFFRILRTRYHELKEVLRYTPYSRTEFYDCLPSFVSSSEEIDLWTQLWLSQFVDDIEWARRYFIVINLGFTHEEDSTSFRSSKEHSVANAIVNHVERIEQVAERLRHVIIENLSYERLFENYDGEDTLWMLDPPYVSPKGEKATTYKHGFTIGDHVRLLHYVDNLKGQVVLCGYLTPEYSTFLCEPKWKLHKFERMAHVGNSKYKDRETRTECVWIKQTKYTLEQSIVKHELF